MSQQFQPQYAPYQYNVLPTSGLATASLVTGILGFVLLPLVCSIIAIVTGYAARNETRSIPPRASGDGMATAGIVMGYVQLGLIAVALLCVILSVFLPLGLAGLFGGSQSY